MDWLIEQFVTMNIWFKIVVVLIVANLIWTTYKSIQLRKKIKLLDEDKKKLTQGFQELQKVAKIQQEQLTKSLEDEVLKDVLKESFKPDNDPDDEDAKKTEST